jgi:hypothetical protein
MAIHTNLGFPQAVGIYSDGRTVHVVRAAATLRGSRVVERLSVPVETDEPAALQQALAQLGSRAARRPIVLGVPTERCYFTTRPVSVMGGASPNVLLRESLRSPSAPIDQLIADTVTSRPDRRDVVGIAACDRNWLASLCQPLVERDLWVAGAEPAPCALLRLAEREDRKHRKAGLVVRVFLNDSQMLAVLASGVQPIVWRTAPLTRGDEAAAILALVRSVNSVSNPCGIEREPGAVVVHGRQDLERLVDVQWVRQHLRTQFGWLANPSLDAADVARGLTLRGLEDGDDGFDLAREYRRQPTLWQLFPGRLAVACAALLLVMAGLLWHRKTQVETAAALAHRTADRLVAPAVPTAELQDEQKDLAARVAAVKKFVDSRVVWTTLLRELSNQLPDSIYLTSLQADAELPTKPGKSVAKRGLVVKGAVALSASGLVPHEVDRLVNTLRGHPVIARDFPLVELADLKHFQNVGDNRALALFTIICLPKAKKAAG